MTKVKIETLTCVHIGSGNLLYKDNDYCLTTDDYDYPVIGIVDPRKVLGLIGHEHIEDWIRAIEKRRPLSDFIRQYAPKAAAEDYTLRLIDNPKEGKPDTLKEMIHDGRGVPYIPGSSLKGAIRTAVLATVENEKAEKAAPEQLLSFGKLTKASSIEGALFGQSANKDIFRFLQVGDAYFGSPQAAAEAGNDEDEEEPGPPTTVLTMVNLNERLRQSFWDVGKQQPIEALCNSLQTSFELRLNTALYDRCRDKVGRMPACMSSLETLFRTINRHTELLLEGEVAHWLKRESEDDSDHTSKYVGACRKLLAEVKACSKSQGHSCILRVGHASGWRFMTGAWTEGNPDFDKVKERARPLNNLYREYDFPKSRRITSGNNLIGFVRLTLP